MFHRRFGESSVPCPSRVLCHERRDQQTIDTRYLRPGLFMLVTWPFWVAADDCRAAEKRHELAALHSITSSARARLGGLEVDDQLSTPSSSSARRSRSK
jgi:hypothetical protein